MNQSKSPDDNFRVSALDQNHQMIILELVH